MKGIGWKVKGMAKGFIIIEITAGHGKDASNKMNYMAGKI